MESRTIMTLWIACATAWTPLFAQTSAAGTASVTGKYNFVYAVWERGQAFTLMGSVQFDGNGSYSLEARRQGGESESRAVSALGSYRVLADGTGQMTSPIDPLLPPLSLRLGRNATTVSGSTLEQSTTHHHDLFLAIPSAATNRSPADLNGAWAGVHNVYLPGSTPVARAGRFSFQFDGQGRVSSNSWTFHQSDQSNGAAQTTTSSGAYTLAPDGVGTFESVFGRKRVALSADGNVLLGTDDASGQELIFAVKLTPAANQGPTGRFYWEQLVVAAPGGTDPRASASSWALTNDLGEITATGLPRAAGSQQFLDGPTGRLLDMSAMLGPFTIAPTGLVDLGFGGLASAGLGAMSQGTQYLTWTNLTASVTGTYSFNVLLPAPEFSAPAGTAAWLDPVGAVHRAGFHSVPGPFAPGTLMSVRGARLAASSSAASSPPLPTTLGGTQLLANGQPAALYEVSPSQITFVLPNATAGSGRVELRAVTAAGSSNSIVIRSAPSLPALFAQAGNGLGPAMAQHASGAAVTANAPAQPGEVITFYATGLGLVAGAPAEGVAATGPAPVTIPVQVDVAGALAEVLYAGLAPGYPSLYQVNVRIPSTLAPNAAANVRIHQGYTQSHPKVTIPIGQ